MTFKEELSNEIENNIKELIRLKIIDPNLIKYINELNLEDKKKYIQKVLTIGEDKEVILQLEKMMLISPIKYRKLIFTMLLSKAEYIIRLESINNRKKYSNIMAIYEKVLLEIFTLSKELKLNNSLELSNLYTYLLWNGYLSKNKVKEHSSKGRKFIHGLHFADIMDGKGVCLDNSEMLKDFLNVCGYPSAIIDNYCDDIVKIDYILLYKMLGLEENMVSTNALSKEVTVRKHLEQRKIGNHSFNLIEDNNKLYIYDATGALIHRIISPYYSELIVGIGKNKLFPYQSHITCQSKQEYVLVDKLIETTDYTPPYTKEDFIFTGEKELETIKNNKSLIEDFYNEIKPSIIGISKETDKIKARIRTNN